MRIIFIDLETTGLDPLKNQIVEVGMVPVENGVVLNKQVDHFYIDHPNLTYNVDALRKFGTRLDDRKRGAAVLLPGEAESRIRSSIKLFTPGRVEGSRQVLDKPHLGGKNVGSFDLQFLKVLVPDIESLTKHRAIDLGNLFHRPDDTGIPDLAECLRRGKCWLRAGFNTKVTHTALDDAMVCAELYAGWYRINKQSYEMATAYRDQT